MNCKKTQELLPEFYEGTLDEQNVDLVQAHIESCDDCREIIEALFNYFDGVKEIKTVNAPEDFKDRVLSHFTNEEVQKRRVPFFYSKFARYAALAAAALIFLYFVLPGRYFETPCYTINYVPKVEKAEKRGKKGKEYSEEQIRMIDQVIVQVEALTEKYQGQIIADEEYISIEITKDKYVQFRNDMLAIIPDAGLPEKPALSISRKVRFNIKPDP